MQGKNKTDFTDLISDKEAKANKNGMKTFCRGHITMNRQLLQTSVQ